MPRRSFDGDCVLAAGPARLPGRLAPAAPVTLLHYRNAQHSELLWAVPSRCAPALLHALEQLLAKSGYVRVES